MFTNVFASYFSSILVLRILFLISNLLNVPTYVVRQLQLSTIENEERFWFTCGPSHQTWILRIQFHVWTFLSTGGWVGIRLFSQVPETSLNELTPFFTPRPRVGGFKFPNSRHALDPCSGILSVARCTKLLRSLNCIAFMFLAGQNIIWRSSVTGYWPEMIYFQYSQSIHIILLCLYFVGGPLGSFFKKIFFFF